MSQEIESAVAPLACSLPPAARLERTDEIAILFRSAGQVLELADGYGFQFPSTAVLAEQLLAFILAERECCPFFRFELVFPPDGGATWLHLRGSAEVKALIAAEWAGPLSRLPDAAAPPGGTATRGSTGGPD